MDNTHAICGIIALVMFLLSGVCIEIAMYSHKHLDDSESNTPAEVQSLTQVSAAGLILIGLILYMMIGRMGTNYWTGSMFDVIGGIGSGFLISLAIRYVRRYPRNPSATQQ